MFTEDNKTKLIAHVIYRFNVGGLENGLVNLINRMPEEKYRHAIICLTDYTDFKDRLQKDVQIYSLHKKQGKDIGLYYRLWKTFREIKPDIVHTRNLAALEAHLPALLAGVKCRIHGEHGWDVNDLDGGSRKYRVLRKIYGLLIHRFIPLSAHLKEYLVKKVGISEKKMRQICNGVDVEKFHPGTDRKTHYPVASFNNQDSLIIGTVGRLEAVKDQMNLVRSFTKLIGSRPEYRETLRLMLVGDGSEKDNIESFVQDNGLADVVWLAGSRDDIPDLLNAMDIFVLPSLAEGISNTILEAMACGLPVVATDVGGNRELVSEGATGYIVPRADPDAMANTLLKYIDNPKLRIQHAKNARVRAVQEFSIDTMVNKYIKVYDEVLANKF